MNGGNGGPGVYIEGYVDYGRQFTKYDDLYFTINKHGGHIHINDNKDNRIKTPMDSGKTIMLYNLNSISFVNTYFQGHRKDHTTHNYNFYDLIINAPILDISFFISSDRKGSNINELSIYYQCADDSQNCNISEISHT
jgi:hypothetical protein